MNTILDDDEFYSSIKTIYDQQCNDAKLTNYDNILYGNMINIFAILKIHSVNLMETVDHIIIEVHILIIILICRIIQQFLHNIINKGPDFINNLDDSEFNINLHLYINYNLKKITLYKGIQGDASNIILKVYECIIAEFAINNICNIDITKILLIKYNVLQMSLNTLLLKWKSKLICTQCKCTCDWKYNSSLLCTKCLYTYLEMEWIYGEKYTIHNVGHNINIK